LHKNEILKVDWLDPLKGIALLGVMFNHLVEELQTDSWFVSSSGIWAGILERVSNPLLFENDSSLVVFVKLLAWIGDYCPGVFILASGFGISWALLDADYSSIDWKAFFKRRALRLYPAYIFLHFLFLGGALFIAADTTTIADPKILLSLLGIRITDALFFFINPSWWFVWLIIQLYLVFPALFILLTRQGVGKFLLITFLIAFFSRLSGILGIRYSDSLYFWLLGIFGGTRLAEFAAGMAFAVLLRNNVNKFGRLGEMSNIILFSVSLLTIGLVLSFFRYGHLVDHLMITIGLSGSFYVVWRLVAKMSRALSRVIAMIGFESYGIYLVHQLMLQKGMGLFSDEWQVAGAIAIIIISFPAGIYLIRLSDGVAQILKGLRRQEAV
jgi:peptidoglycan/LPS O-acetylase OafA/YrhL